MPCGSGSLHFAKYECTVLHLGKSLGNIRHWQPLRSKYSTAQNTSYKSTVVGLVRFLTLCNTGRISSKFLATDVASVGRSHSYIIQLNRKIVNTF